MITLPGRGRIRDVEIIGRQGVRIVVELTAVPTSAELEVLKKTQFGLGSIGVVLHVDERDLEVRG